MRSSLKEEKPKSKVDLCTMYSKKAESMLSAQWSEWMQGGGGEGGEKHENKFLSISLTKHHASERWIEIIKLNHETR